MEDKHLYRETQWDVSAEESRAHHGLVAIGFAVLAVLVIAFCIWTFGGRGGAAWEFEADATMIMLSSGGSEQTPTITNRWQTVIVHVRRSIVPQT